jgi:FkbM family methyltransferase
MSEVVENMLKFWRRAQKLIKLAQSSVYRKGLKHNVAAAIEHAVFIESIDHSVGFLIDVGANKGQFSLLFRNYFADAPIYAFEPLSGPAATFRNLFQGDASAHLFEGAIGSMSGKAKMYISQQLDSSSLLPITAKQVTSFPGTEQTDTCEIDISPMHEFLNLDTLTGKGLMKIDVQGYELEVLKASQALLSHIELVYVESSFIELYEGQPLFHEVQGWLAENSFSLQGIGAVSFSKGSIVQCDFIFKRL